MRYVIAKDFFLHTRESRTNGRNLRDDVDAIAIVIDHTNKAANLTLDAVEALHAGYLGILLHD